MMKEFDGEVISWTLFASWLLGMTLVFASLDCWSVARYEGSLRKRGDCEIAIFTIIYSKGGSMSMVATHCQSKFPHALE